MVHIMFVCHGNICRSTMAEFVFKNLVHKHGLSDYFHISSSATSREEIGNDTHSGTKRKLKEEGIPFTRRAAVQITSHDYNHYDYILCMDQSNLRNLTRIIPTDPQCKIRRLLDFTPHPRDIADPWYTGNFNTTYEDVVCGCEAFLTFLLESSSIQITKSDLEA